MICRTCKTLPARPGTELCRTCAEQLADAMTGKLAPLAKITLGPLDVVRMANNAGLTVDGESESELERARR